jgi:hypothetical protein
MDFGKTKNIVPSASSVFHRAVISDKPSNQGTSQYAISKFCPGWNERYCRILPGIYNFRNCSFPNPQFKLFLDDLHH